MDGGAERGRGTFCRARVFIALWGFLIGDFINKKHEIKVLYFIHLLYNTAKKATLYYKPFF